MSSLVPLNFSLSHFRFFFKQTHLQFPFNTLNKMALIEPCSSHVIDIFGNMIRRQKMLGQNVLPLVEKVDIFSMPLKVLLLGQSKKARRLKGNYSLSI